MTESDNGRTVVFQSPPAAKPGDGTAPAPPQRLGKYVLGEPLGTGSPGTVYRTTDPDTRRELVIRVIPSSLLRASGASSPARFRSGIQQASSLSHPGVVPIRLYGEEAGFAYVSMDYVKGSSLQARFEAKVQFSLEQVIDIQAQLLQALQYVHDRSQCHGALTPANVLITTNGRVRVKNFGLAQAALSKGTSGYSAPEQHDGAAPDQRSDVYAAGAIFYALLTGAPPVGGERLLSPSTVTGQPSLRSFDRLALHALSPDPSDRLPSVAAFLEGLLEGYVYGGDGEDAPDRTLAGQTPEALPADLTRLLNEAPVEAPVEATVEEPDAPVEVAVPALPEPTTILSAAPTLVIKGPPPEPPTVPRSAPTTPAAASSSASSPVIELPAPAAPPAALFPETVVTSIPPPTTATPGNAAAAVARIELRLMQTIGPIAVIMVRRGTRETTDTASLVQWLAARIDSSSEREKFLADLSMVRFAAPPATSGAPATSATDAQTRVYFAADSPETRAVTSDDIARAAQLLTTHLGPIASILARRTAQQPGCSREQFVTTLAGHLPDERERERFIKAFR